MKLHYIQDHKWNVVLQREELDTIMTAVRYILDNRQSRIPQEARQRLRVVFNRYQDECSQFSQRSRKQSAKE